MLNASVTAQFWIGKNYDMDKVEYRKSPVDGLFRAWQLKKFDENFFPIWVCVGVFDKIPKKDR